MAVPNVKHTVVVPAAGLNIDQGGAIPAQVYKIRALNAFGPLYRVDASGSIDATAPTFFTTQEPEKMRGVGEQGGHDTERNVVVNLQAGQRIALRPAAGESVNIDGRMHVEITAEQPFTL
jgi:hypothetical protein